MIPIGRKIAFQFFSFSFLTGGILSTALVGNAQDKNLHAGEEQEVLVPDKDWGKDDKELKEFQGYRRGDAGSLCRRGSGRHIRHRRGDAAGISRREAHRQLRRP